MLRSAIKQGILKCATALPFSGKQSFTKNLAHHIYDDAWKDFFNPFAGKPRLKYLEIGVFEGRSLFWMLENVLTHPTSKAVGIDLGAATRHRLISNLAKFPQSRKITVIDSHSDLVLHKMKWESFDIVYIDGGHDVRSVLIDAIYSWRLLRPGGLLIFDDYLLGQNRFPVDLTPKPAVDAFLMGFVSELDILHQDKQVVVRKRELPTYRYHSETSFGHYVYEWYSGRLSRVEKKLPRLRMAKNELPLSPNEQKALEAALRASPNGADALYSRTGDEGHPFLVELGRRLGIPVREPLCD